jgi:hypothetical protein
MWAAKQPFKLAPSRVHNALGELDIIGPSPGVAAFARPTPSPVSRTDNIGGIALAFRLMCSAFRGSGGSGAMISSSCRSNGALTAE